MFTKIQFLVADCKHEVCYNCWACAVKHQIRLECPLIGCSATLPMVLVLDSVGTLVSDCSEVNDILRSRNMSKLSLCQKIVAEAPTYILMEEDESYNQFSLSSYLRFLYSGRYFDKIFYSGIVDLVNHTYLLSSE